jgi:hypothetical protein
MFAHTSEYRRSGKMNTSMSDNVMADEYFSSAAALFGLYIRTGFFRIESPRGKLRGKGKRHNNKRGALLPNLRERSDNAFAVGLKNPAPLTWWRMRGLCYSSDGLSHNCWFV